MIFVNLGLDLFERISNLVLQLVQERSAKRVPEVFVIEVGYSSPFTVIG